MKRKRIHSCGGCSSPLPSVKPEWLSGQFRKFANTARVGSSIRSNCRPRKGDVAKTTGTSISQNRRNSMSHEKQSLRWNISRDTPSGKSFSLHWSGRCARSFQTAREISSHFVNRLVAGEIDGRCASQPATTTQDSGSFHRWWSAGSSRAPKINLRLSMAPSRRQLKQ